MIPNIQTCTRCIMDTTAPDIVFDEQGICNYCTAFLEKKAKHIAVDPEERERRLPRLIEMVKASGHRKRYDCIVGL